MTFKGLILREAERQARHGVEPARWVGPRNRRSRSVHQLEADAAVAVGTSPLPALLDDVRARRRSKRGASEVGALDASGDPPPR